MPSVSSNRCRSPRTPSTAASASIGASSSSSSSSSCREVEGGNEVAGESKATQPRSLWRHHQQQPPPRLRKSSWLPFLVVINIATLAGLFHCGHVATMHENHITFSLLSNVEREITFRSEAAFYYSFFKQIVYAKSFREGFTSLLDDRHTEYPGELVLDATVSRWNTKEWGYLPSLAKSSDRDGGLNALQRFNIYPEVLLAAFYRLLAGWDLLDSTCFQVAVEGAGENYAMVVPANEISVNHTPPRQPFHPIGPFSKGESVISCDGSREPPLFYVNCVFSLTGLTTFGLALSGWQVANCRSANPSMATGLVAVWGAVLPVVGFFFNHAEASRVQWTPQLRESFAYPFFVLQQTVVIWLLKDITPSIRNGRHRSGATFFAKCLLYIALLLAFQLPWQFAQFALLTQLAALMAAYVATTTLLLTNNSTASTPPALFSAFAARLEELLVCQLIALTASWALQLGNQLLLTSAYLPCLVGCFVGLFFHRRVFDPMNPASLKNMHAKRVRPTDRRLHYLLLHMALLIGVCAGVSLAVALVIGRCLGHSDGAHIFDLLKVKLFGSAAHATFHTQLYTCALEFDFLPLSTLMELSQTGLLPASLLAVVIVLIEGIWRLPRTPTCSCATCSASCPTLRPPDPTTTTTDHQLLQQQKIVLTRETSLLVTDAVSNFVIFQLAAFAILAGFMMRLKLFLTPQLCLTLAIFAQPRLFFGSHKLVHLFRGCCRKTSSNAAAVAASASAASSSGGLGTKPKDKGQGPLSLQKLFVVHSLFMLCLAASAYKGVSNLQAQWDIKNQFSNFGTQTLLRWAADLPQKRDSGGGDQPWVFSGSMPVMATLRAALIAGGNTGGKFAITNHPHYENAGIRLRTELAYSIYSRKPLEAVWTIYRHILKTDFVVVEVGLCRNKSPKAGCAVVEMLDLLEPVGLPADGPVCDVSDPADLAPFFVPVLRTLDNSILLLRVVPL